MGVLRWFIANWADTNPPTHPDLTPFEIPIPPDRAVDGLRAAVTGTSSWRVESVEAGPPVVVRLTHRTRVFRFVDDVTVRLEPSGTGTRVHARSKSRIGVADLGQNRRNLLDLFATLRSLA